MDVDRDNVQDLLKLLNETEDALKRKVSIQGV